jgi:hypothetical protein
MHVCPIAGEYLWAGQIIRDGPYFALPDKSHIRQYGNETSQQVIDARYAMAAPSTPATRSNTIPVNNS